MSKEEKEKKLNEFYQTEVGTKCKNQYNIALGILFVVAGLCCMTLLIEETISASNNMLDLIDMVMLIVIIVTVGYAGYNYGCVMGAFNYYLSILQKKEENINKKIATKEEQTTKTLKATTKKTQTTKTTKKNQQKKKKPTKTKE